MKRLVHWSRAWLSGLLAITLSSMLQQHLLAATAALVGWSEVGIHETDGSDVSVYSLMPPYSTIHAQLVVGGLLVTNPAGLAVTYQAVADSTGSINSTSQGKGNFYQYAQALYGVALGADQGLAGFGMPGPNNQPQAMTFDPAQNWFTAQGIPVTPYDDQGRKNKFPMMRLVARGSANNVLATTDITLPVTDEMDCRACHASGSSLEARPPEGWEWAADPVKDYKLNILRSHDDHQLGTKLYAQVLSAVGYNTAGLVATVKEDGKPVSCILCHATGPIPGTGVTGVRPLTPIMHTKHAYVTDPKTGGLLTFSTNSAACLLCHAGPEQQFVRGVHHNTVNADGSLAMQCQNCHGSMTVVGAPGRKGWVDEPACQSCHTGTATRNAGSLRYTTIFDGSGQLRQAVDSTFAAQTNSTVAALSPFQTSAGHGGLKCASCHGAPHAELLSLQANDNVQNQKLQGATGILTSCVACHTNTPSSQLGGPHGMHPVDARWASNHGEGFGRTSCQACHGTDYRGTALSWAQADRIFGAIGTQHFWPKFQAGCYTCHFGPDGTDVPNTNVAPTVVNVAASTSAETPVQINLAGSDANGTALSFRAVSQPLHGTVSVSGKVANYFPGPGFVGIDSFTYAAWDGSTDSNLGTVNLTITPGQCVLTLSTLVPTADFPNVPVPFRAAGLLSKCAGAISYDWDFGDGTAHGNGTNVAHVYPAAGDYNWSLTATGSGISQTASGVLTISPTLGPPLVLTLTWLGFMVEVSWPVDTIPTSLEASTDLAEPYSWQMDLDPVFSDGITNNVYVLVTSDTQYFRVRRVP
ncbi:MAG TPA: PKD domain-containing protein [Candidatus Limnocylindrales bacterium]|nr:PKD domain-containing protein [Candidatus Limnocylindrales bacterium]